MSEQQFFFSRPGEPSLFCRLRTGKNNQPGLILVHGFAEHSGRYGELMNELEKTGRALLAFDLRGHGRSEGARAAIGRWEEYEEDLAALRDYVCREHGFPDKAVVLGHSMGGLIALDGANHWSWLNALVLSSPCLGLRSSSLLLWLNSGIQALCPSFRYPSPVTAQKLTHDAALQTAHRNDPLILRHISARLVFEMNRRGQSLRGRDVRLNVPVCFMLAGEEKVVDARAALAVYARLDSPQKKLHCFQGFRHEIFNEVDRQIAYHTLLAFLNALTD